MLLVSGGLKFIASHAVILFFVFIMCSFKQNLFESFLSFLGYLALSSFSSMLTNALGGPRPPLISPPSFFGATPASTIRQRGPPPPSYSSSHGPRPTGPPHLHHGPGPNAVASTSQNGHSNFPTPSLPPSAKSCVMLSNVPTTSTDSDLARFLGINSTRVNSCMYHISIYNHLCETEFLKYFSVVILFIYSISNFSVVNHKC